MKKKISTPTLLNLIWGAACLFALICNYYGWHNYRKADTNSQFWAHRYWLQLDSTKHYKAECDSLMGAMIDHSELRVQGNGNTITLDNN